MKPTITDRAKRYRAQRSAPPGRKICNFCADKQNVGIDHISGREDDGDAENLMYLCKSCNTTKGIVQARHRIGIRTRQYNPMRVPTFTEFKEHAATLLGIGAGDPAEATAAIRSTPPATRSRYAEKIHAANPFKSDAQRRKFFAMADRGEISMATLRRFAAGNPAAPTFQQYAHGVSIHSRGAHDEGGAIIHATPPALRRKYAQQIAQTKRERGTDRREDIPF
jgi:hypothetical protein